MRFAGIGLPLALLLGCSDYAFQTPVDLSASGTPAIRVDPGLLDFWEVAADETVFRTFTITNVGDATLAVDSLALSGAGGFTLVQDPTPLLLPIGASQTIELGFSPEVAEEQIGLVEVASDDPDAPLVPVDLLGAGRVPMLYIQPEDHAFGELAVPCTDQVQLTLSNIGNEALHLERLDYTADAGLSFRHDLALPLTLAVGESRTAWVDLQPSEAGALSGSLSAGSNDPRGDAIATQSATGLAGDLTTETFPVTDDPPVDVLFAVDRSCSMEDDAQSLADNFTSFTSALAEDTSGWQVGVVTTDDACFLTGILTAETNTFWNKFELSVTTGEDAEIQDDEALLKLADRALQQTAEGACNEGLHRPGAMMHVIVLSDEPERSAEQASAWTWDYWVERMTDVVGEGALKVSGVVDLDDCNEGADGYIEAIQATGGEALSICGADWGTAVADLAAASLTQVWSYSLVGEPAPGTVEVAVDGVDQTTGWSYRASTRTVVFDARPGGNEVTVRYATTEACAD